jgi:hypothetical protein
VNLDCTGPSFAGEPLTSATVGIEYSFTPTVNNGCGDLIFSIDENQPEWVEFDTATGRLYGTPSPQDWGETEQITIRVEDDYGYFDELVFAIDVGCTPPSISGNPPASVATGRLYSFTPTVEGGCGALVFSSDTKPNWAEIDPATGRLFGTPAAGYVGTTSGIYITVIDDEDHIDELGPFSITVTDAKSGGGGGCFISSLWK